MSNKYKEWRNSIICNIDNPPELSGKTANSKKLELTSDFFLVYLYELTGFIFSINDRWNENVHFHMLTRKKSPKSRSKKAQRFKQQVENGTRLDSNIHDDIASTFIIDRVDESDDLAQYSSDEVIKRYSERKQDIDLLGNLINFFNKQVEIGDFYSEYDKTETLDASIHALSVSFNTDFTDNIKRYRPSCDITKIKPTQLDQRILNIIRNKRTEIILLEKELLQKGSVERKEKIIEEVEYYDKAIEILKAKISKKTSKVDNEVEDEQENYFKYLIILLDRVQALEYEECKESYNEVSQELKRNIEIFIYKMVNEERSFNDNVTLENLVLLEKWCKKLNAQMSDKLQQAIVRDSMIDNAFLNNEQGLDAHIENDELGNPKIQSHIKSNGYVADHYNLISILKENNSNTEICTELKGMTHYRYKVASRGNASYGNSRLDPTIRNEKKRPIKLLPTTIPSDKTLNSNSGILEKVKVIEGFGSIEELKSNPKQLENWKKEIYEITPRYVTSRYDSETKCVVHTIHSILNNVETYFGETNIRKQRKIVREGISIIKEEGLLPDENKEISINMDTYLECMENGSLMTMIRNTLKSLEFESTQNVQDTQDIVQ